MDLIKPLVKRFVVTAVVYSIALFYGWVAVISSLFKWLRAGNSYWYIKERPLPPSCLQDTAYGKHSYVRLQDLKIHYVENGDRSKPLMLFVHGFPEFWFSWRHQLKHFAKSHWVVALDLRGYGDSDKPSKVTDYKIDLLRKDIHDFVKALGREKCILVAHDWGAIISWGVAMEYPSIVEKLIILNCPHPAAGVKKITSSLKQFLKSWYMFVFQLPYLPELLWTTNDLAVFDRIFGKNVNQEDMEAFKYTWARRGAWTPPINYYRNLVIMSALTDFSKIPRITAPTLIIWGEDDLALEKDMAEMSTQYVDDIRVEYIPNGNHFIQQDKPQEVNSAIQKFLR